MSVGKPPTIMRRKSKRQCATRSAAAHHANNSKSKCVSKQSDLRCWKRRLAKATEFYLNRSSNGLRQRPQPWG